MSKFLKTFCLVLLISIPSLSLKAQETLEQLEQSALPEIVVPKIDRHQLGSGMKVLLLPDHALPVVRGYLYVKTGSIYEAADKLGLAEVTGNLLRTGGTSKTKPEAFDEKLAAIGADIDVDITREFGLITFKCLREDLPEVLGLIFEMIQEPAFDEQKLGIQKIQMLESLRRKNDNPAETASREFGKLVYGKDNIWARTPEPKDIQSLTREDVKNFHQKFFYPDRMIFALAGDFNAADLLSHLEKLSQNWAKAPTPLEEVSPLQETWKSETVLIPKTADQSTIFIGHWGDKRSNQDKYALLLLNEILGGDALTSRLGKQIRSTLGLVYGIYSHYGLQTDYGLFSVIAQTKAKNTAQVIAETRKQLQAIRQPGSINQGEMEFYKNSLLNSLYSQYEPTYNFAKDEARFDYFGYPPNYLELFRQKLQAVTLEDLHRVAEKYLRPDYLQVLVVGDPKAIGPLSGAKIVSP